MNKNNAPLISILIPCYNGEKTIGKTITSVLNQTYNNLDIVIINDGSTDNTLKVVNDFATNDKRIRIISQENQGLSITRNVLVNNSLGEYFYFIDADDFIELNTIELLTNETKNNEDLVFAKSFVGEEKSEKKFNFHSNIKKGYTSEDLLMKVCTYAWGILINKEFWDKYMFSFLNVKKVHLEDILIVYVFSKAKKIGIIDSYLYHYQNDFQKKINKFQCESSLEQIRYLYSLLDIKNISRGVNDALSLIYSNTFYAFKFISSEDKQTKKKLLKKLKSFYKSQPKLKMPKDAGRWFYFLFAKCL